MRTTMLLTLTLLLVTAACYFPSAQEERTGIVGTYVVNGFDPDGIEYGGVLRIDATDVADEFDMRWVVTGTVQEGRGTLSNDQLEVTWQTTADFAVYAEGTATYEVDGDGVLTGTRQVAGSDGVGTEEAFPDL